MTLFKKRTVGIVIGSRACRFCVRCSKKKSKGKEKGGKPATGEHTIQKEPMQPKKTEKNHKGLTQSFIGLGHGGTKSQLVRKTQKQNSLPPRQEKRTRLTDRRKDKVSKMRGSTLFEEVIWTVTTVNPADDYFKFHWLNLRRMSGIRM